MRVDPEELFQKNDEYHQALMANLYGQLRADPLVDPEALVRMYLYAYFKSEGEELIAKNMDQVSQVLGQPQPMQPAPSPMGQMAQGKALSTGMAGAMSSAPSV